MQIAIQFDYYEIVQILLNHEKIDVNLCYGDGWSPLHIAVEKNSKDVVKWLLQYPNIDINIKFKSLSPCDLAKKLKYTEIEQLIIAHTTKQQK